MKKLLSVFLVFAILLSFSACGAAKPEDTVKKYFVALKEFDSEKMAEYVLASSSATDETTPSADDDDNDDDDYFSFFEDYMKENASKLTYKITNTEVDGSKAVVTADVNYVDGSELIRAVMGEYMQLVFTSAFSDEEMTDAEMDAAMFTIMKDEMSKTTETFKDAALQINCVLQDKVWYIEDVSDEMADVLSSGLFGTMEDIGDSFSGFDS